MELEYSLTEGDYRETNRIVGTLQLGRAFRVKAFIAAFSAVVVLSAGAGLLAGYAGAIGVMFGMAIGLALVLVMARALPKKFKPTNPNGFLAAQKLAVSEDGLRMVTRFRTEEVKWPYFIGFRETEALFLLFVEPGQVKVVPKRAFRNDHDRNRFLELCRTNIPPGDGVPSRARPVPSGKG